MLQTIERFIQEHYLISPEQTIVIGLSGGPDSIFLLHYLKQWQKKYKLTLIAAHLNHAWRPEAADDARFCQKAADALGIPFVSQTIAELDITIKDNGSKEAMGRTARRYFLEKVADRYEADTIALAHHKDDQEETFFIRLLRGASLTGLCGMRPQHGRYIRPLLSVSKQDILQWLDEHTIAYLQDPTNADDSFLRNRIRNQLMPLLRTIDDRADQNIIKAIGHLQQADQLLAKLASYTFDQLATLDEETNTYGIDIAPFLHLDSAMQYRVLVHWLSKQKVPFPVSQGFFDEVIRFCKHACCSKEHAIHQHWTLKTKENRLYIIEQ